MAIFNSYVSLPEGIINPLGKSTKYPGEFRSECHVLIHIYSTPRWTDTKKRWKARTHDVNDQIGSIQYPENTVSIFLMLSGLAGISHMLLHTQPLLRIATEPK